MSEHGSYLRDKHDAANIPTIRNEADVARANFMEPINEEGRRLDRWAAAKGRDNLRAQIDGDAKEVAFRRAVRNLPLSPEQIAIAVEQFFDRFAEATPAEKSEEVATASATEESGLSTTLPCP